MKSLFFLSLIVASGMLAVSCSTAPAKDAGPAAPILANEDRDVAKVQDDTTPFDHLKVKLKPQPGQTYLAFVMNEVKPSLDKFSDLVRNHPAYKQGEHRKLQNDLIKNGNGVAIRIDAKNYIFNVGYMDGSNRRDDVLSGRSYGVGPTGRQSDPSDKFFLKELDHYYSGKPKEIETFVHAIMRMLLNCDASGWRELSTEGQTVATDFLAIYTAELDRHMMVGLRNRYPWEIDLIAATIVSIYTVNTGKVMKQGQLVTGRTTDWSVEGGWGRRGIGNTRKDRKRLQQMIARQKSISKVCPEILEGTELAGAGDDPLQAVFEFMGSKDGARIKSSTAAKFEDVVVKYAEVLSRSD